MSPRGDEAHQALPSAFAGIVTFNGAAVAPNLIERLGRNLTAWRSGHLVTHNAGGAVFIARHAAPSATHPEDSTGDAHRDPFAALARLTNRAELCDELGLSLSKRARMTDAAILRHIFMRRGESGIARCTGAFCFASWDSARRRLVLGRDCLGEQALFFHRGRDFNAFATTLRVLHGLPGVPYAVDEEVLAKYLALNLDESRRTFYRGIERVPSRMMVSLDSLGVTHRHYWSPGIDAPPPFARAEDYVDRARELLDRAVIGATTDTPHVAIAASGGLDSSAVAATVARLGGARRITCYTLAPPEGSTIDVGAHGYWDERAKMDALARLHPALDVKIVAPQLAHPYEEDDTRFFARTTLPALNPSNLGWFNHLYDAAVADGHRVILNGQRGNFGLSWRGTLSLVALIADGRWRDFAREWPAVARQSGRSLTHTFAADVVRPVAPGFVQRALYRLRTGDPRSVARFSVLNPDTIAQRDWIRQWQDEGFAAPWFGATGWNAARLRAHFLFDRNQFARDQVAMMPEQLGFALRDPHADRSLLEFLLRVPEPLYRQGGVPRAFARAVLADRLPPDILGERRSGAQSGLWFRRLDARKAAIAAEIERLGASPLAQRLLDLKRMKRLVDDWPKDDAAAELRKRDYHLALHRGLHIGRFVRWVERGNQ